VRVVEEKRVPTSTDMTKNKGATMGNIKEAPIAPLKVLSSPHCSPKEPLFLPTRTTHLHSSTMENEVKKTVSNSSDVANIHQPTDFPLARALTPEQRVQVEKRLKLKLDLRCSLFVLIYILSEFSR
jgi:hypothetical protein